MITKLRSLFSFCLFACLFICLFARVLIHFDYSSCYYVDDFLPTIESSVTFTPESETELCITIQSSDDQILENTEEFSFSVAFNDPAITAVVPANGQIIIFDNDGK